MQVHLTDHSKDSYERALRGMGYRSAGSGCYANVFVKGKHALKVCDTGQNDAYFTYLASLVNVSDTNPWKPKIYDVKMFASRKGATFFVVCMERLKNLPRRDEEEFSPCDRASNKELIAIAGKKQRGAEEILRWVFALNASKFHSLDIHCGNIMKRSNGEYVLTDPVC